MTRGLYVRGFARDLGIKLNIPCMILDLVRLEDGATSKEDCLHPEDYFKEEILKNQNFLFPDFKKL
jgi:tRNA U55 pseudouridine synthase TruB